MYTPTFIANKQIRQSSSNQMLLISGVHVSVQMKNLARPQGYCYHFLAKQQFPVGVKSVLDIKQKF